VSAQRDVPHHKRPAHRLSALIPAALVGVVVGAGVSLATTLEFAALAGWDTTVALYLAWVWTRVWRLDGERTARLAVHEDPTRAATDLILLTAAVASLVAVGFVLGGAAHARGAEELGRVTLGLGSVVLSWSMVHTVFALRYARLYYSGAGGAVDFNEDAAPSFSDFAYLAFTIGMTFQVSDTPLQGREVRRTALRHALLSYLFGTGILATTINLVASLTSR
jgi:uncharacterized membrane protein